MKRVAMASYVGSAIEYYDFYIYGTAAALVFPKVFFPHLGMTMATVASMATFAAAFLSRPLGAAFFGHFGDRLGRKSTLIATLSDHGAVHRDGGSGSRRGDDRHGGAADPADAAPRAGLRGRRRMGRLRTAVRRIRARRGPRPLRDVHPDGRRQRPRHEQPAVPDREQDDRRVQSGVHRIGVGGFRSCSVRY